MTTPQEAAAIAEELLAGELPRRWAHTQGVARTARKIAYLAGPHAGLLEAAAWLHDIGYAPSIALTGFHPLDGARHLEQIGIDAGVVSLVAYHTNAHIEATERGLERELSKYKSGLPSIQPTCRLLSYCDLTTDPVGRVVSVNERLDDIYRRYAAHDVVHRSIATAEPQLRGIVSSVEADLSAVTQAN